MPRARRKARPGIAHYAAPALFLLGVTIAVLLIRAGLQHDTKTTTTNRGPAPVETTTTTTATSKQPKGATYTVQTGDTFGSIAAKVGISVERLQSLNPGVSSNALQVGQKLRIK
jgi:LysM repeat protein